MNKKIIVFNLTNNFSDRIIKVSGSLQDKFYTAVTKSEEKIFY